MNKVARILIGIIFIIGIMSALSIKFSQKASSNRREEEYRNKFVKDSTENSLNTYSIRIGDVQVEGTIENQMEVYSDSVYVGKTVYIKQGDDFYEVLYDANTRSITIGNDDDISLYDISGVVLIDSPVMVDSGRWGGRTRK